MDFLHRNANQAGQGDTVAALGGGAKFRQIMGGEPRWLRIIFVVLLFSLTILMIAIAMLLYSGKIREGNYVKEDDVQAVFLTNGQVYFGGINEITSEYVSLKGIYYLNSQQDNDNKDETTTNFSLVKLGCELHGPADQMLINRDQVTFWENLKPDGKVTKAIEQWSAQNPDGLKCTDNNSSDTTDQSPAVGTDEDGADTN